MSGELSAAERESLAEAECPDCGHEAHYHHPIGHCDVTTYGTPEDGFQPAEPCLCDTPFDDALAPTVARIVAERTRTASERAWDEGYIDGGDDMFPHTNPYRAAESPGESPGHTEAAEGALGRETGAEGAREGNE